jgi:hypothetical protein
MARAIDVPRPLRPMASACSAAVRTGLRGAWSPRRRGRAPLQGADRAKALACSARTTAALLGIVCLRRRWVRSRQSARRCVLRAGRYPPGTAGRGAGVTKMAPHLARPTPRLPPHPSAPRPWRLVMGCSPCRRRRIALLSTRLKPSRASEAARCGFFFSRLRQLQRRSGVEKAASWAAPPPLPAADGAIGGTGERQWPLRAALLPAESAIGAD